MTPGNATARPQVDATWTSLDSDRTAWDESELRELGERAFYNYPMQLAPGLEAAAALPDSGGIWSDGGRLGAVWVSVASGGVSAATTCATCHASKDEHGLVAGRNNANVDAARIYGTQQSAAPWLRGTVDVTDDGVDNPVAIADLRPLRMQQNLHHAATLRNGPAALAVRIETLIVTSLHESARPPRKVAAALAVYLMSLPLRPLPVAGEAASEAGRAVFARECAGCHRGDEMSGPPVTLDLVGTNPSVGESSDRRTGTYRVPSLRGVGDRHRLFAAGEVEDVAELLSPERKARGHRYGLALDPDNRAALLRYLQAL
jgi:mono/diheme cytochrome c family protein